MKIYFAGEPGGNKIVGEKRMYRLGILSRLITFFYTKQSIDTIEVISQWKVSS